MRFTLLTGCVIALMPICAAGAAVVTKYLSRYTIVRAITHPLFYLVVLMGAYEFLAGWYLYRPGVLHAAGAPLSVMEPVVVFGTVLITILIGVAFLEETINSTQATIMILMVPQLIIVLAGKIPW
jgi:hypothetical protein